MKRFTFYIIFTVILFLFGPSLTVADEWSIKNTKGRVVVTVTYDNPGERYPSFSVSLFSNRVNVRRYKMGELSSLRVDKGKLQPGQWEPLSMRRRRSSGTLFFDKSDVSRAEKIELVIKDVGSVNLRSFKWQLKK